MIEIVAARPIHIGPIANRLREIDELECRIFGHTPKQALRAGILGSTVAWTALIDGRAEAMFGAVPISTLDGRGRVWLLMTDRAARQRKSLVRLGWRYTQALHRHFPILENHVHAHNDLAIRWLSRLGYAVGGVDVIAGNPMRGFVRYLDRS